MNINLKQKTTKFVQSVATSGSRMAKNTVDLVRKIDGNHEKIADHADTIAKAARVTAGIAVVGAAVSAPTGITAVGVALGIVGAPLIVSAAPVLAGAAGVALTVSAGASLYSKSRRKKNSKTLKDAPTNL